MTNTTKDLWLWPENSHIRWWTPADSGLLSLTLPGYVDPYSNVRDWQQRPLSSALKPDLYQIISQQLAKAPDGLRLYLTADLSIEWQSFPFEWFQSDKGRALQGQLLVEREVPRTTAEPVFPLKESQMAILNLLPRDERHYFNEICDIDGVQVYTGKNTAETFLSANNLSALSLLCVIAHGSEQSQPFLSEKGELWKLPTEHGFPPLVVLLNCATDHNHAMHSNLMDYGKSLLQSGTQTVLAPVGQLDAEQAGSFLKNFLEGWQTGQRVDDILLKAKNQANNEYAAQRLQLLGRGDLRSQTEAQTSHLPLLVNRITFQSFQNDGNLHNAVEELRKALNIPYATDPEKQLLKRLDQIEQQLWPLSRSWVVPLLAHLAQAYNHGLFGKYEQARADLDQHLPAQSPAVYHYWADIYYRQGRYALAIEETVKGIKALDTLCTLGEDIVGQLANFLIDLNLPQESEFLCDVLTHCLAKQQTEMGKFNRHKLLDRHARIYLRQGKPEAAIAKYKRKRQESMRDFGEDGHRELAWLLYITAFVGHRDASTYAREAKAILAQATIGEGNDNNIYLMRALAVWAWRDNDQVAVKLLMQYADILNEHLYKGDVGPSGLIFSYLQLYQRTNPEVRLDLPALDAVQAALDSDGYWIELVALSCLLNAGDKQRWLRNFQTQRADCLQYLEKLPAWLVEEADFKASVERQNRREAEVFLGDTTPSREKLIETGLLPL